jgi:hypothetical protein
MSFISPYTTDKPITLSDHYRSILPKEPYLFLVNYEDNFNKYYADVLMNLEHDVILYKTGLRLIKEKAYLLAAFNIVQSRYKFTDEEFQELLRLKSINDLGLFKNGYFKLVFPERFVHGKLDTDYQFIVDQGADFMMMENKRFNKLSEVLDSLTEQLIKKFQ